MEGEVAVWRGAWRPGRGAWREELGAGGVWHHGHRVTNKPLVSLVTLDVTLYPETEQLSRLASR